MIKFSSFQTVLRTRRILPLVEKKFCGRPQQPIAADSYLKLMPGKHAFASWVPKFREAESSSFRLVHNWGPQRVRPVPEAGNKQASMIRVGLQ